MSFYSFIITVLCFLNLSAKSLDSPDLNYTHDNPLSWKEWKKNTILDLKKDFSESTINHFKKLTFNKKVIELDRKQPEFTITFEKYLSNHLNKKKIEKLNKEYFKNKDLLDKIKHKYQVDPKILVSLWGIETYFGNYVGKFNILRSLASLAYDGRRSNFFFGELKKALWIIDNNHVEIDNFKGSWAGAFGQTQFMPSTFANFAVDFNSDNKIDLFQKNDALASAANYLKKSGWINNLTWGEKVSLKLTKDLRQLFEKKSYKNINFWESNGIKFKNDYNKKDKLRLIIPDSTEGQCFLVNKNFDVILNWNRSNYFALTVFLLSNEIKN